MKREELTGIVARAAEGRGYAFHTGEVHTMGGTVREYPVAWLVPPVVQSLSGRTEGEITYRGVLHLAALPASAESEREWARLEEDARRIVAEIAADGAAVLESSRYRKTFLSLM